MNPGLLYLLKVVLCSGLLFGYYLLALRNRIFHQWNRFYLLAAVIFSLAFPLIPLPVIYGFNAESQPIPFYQLLITTGDEATVSAPRGFELSTEKAVWAVYGLVALVLAIRLVLGLLQIRQLVRRHGATRLDAVAFVPTNHPAAPFSFFRWLFWKQELDLHSPTGQSIFRHELVHIKEKHSVDKILLQAVLVLFWANPFFWLLRRELGLIHEFIADKKAADHGGTEALAHMILQSVYGAQYHQLISPFFQKPIKRRLAMLQKTINNPKAAYLGRVLTLPLLAVLLFAFAKTEQQLAAPALQRPLTVIIDAGHGGTDAGATSNGIAEKDLTLSLAKAVQAMNTGDNLKIVLTRTGDEYPALKERVAFAGQQNADLFISLHTMALPQGQVATGNTGKQQGFEVYVSRQNEVSSSRSTLLASALIQQLSAVYPTRPNLLTRSAWVLEAATVPAVLIECGYITNPADRAFITNKANQQLVAQKILSAVHAFAENKDKPRPAMQDTIPKSKTDLEKDLKEMRVNKLDTARTITLIYNDGRQLYLSEREAKAIGLLPPAKTQVSAPDQKALVVVDGVIKGTLAEVGNLDKLIPAEQIAAVNVLKDDAATKKYGAKGASGVIEITTRKAASTEPVFTKVEKAPSFPGGAQGWRRYLEANLRASIPVEKGAPAGTYTTITEFKVASDGTISELKPLTTHGYGMEEAVVEMFKKGPKWEPAEQNGRKVTALHQQKVTFVVAAQ